MKMHIRVALMLSALGLVLLGCGDNPVSESFSEQQGTQTTGNTSEKALSKTGSTPEQSFYSTLINTFWVTFDGHVFDGTATTFTYTVSETEGGLDNFQFSVDIPACAGELQAWNPTNGVSLNSDPNTGVINGIDWHPSTPVTSATFSITFPGDLPLGIVDLALRSGSEHDESVVQPWYGPCSGELFDIAGTVFNDANGNETLDPGESGIPDATVQLDNDNGYISVTTDQEGNYVFADLFPSTYQASMPAEIPGYVPTTPTTLSNIIIGPDKLDNHFGFVQPFDISGTIFVDNANPGILDPGESGITKVTVQLNHGCRDGISSTLTNEWGRYLFEGCIPISEDGYVVSIPAETADNPDDFNEGLFESFTPTTQTQFDVSPEDPVKNFGFAPNTRDIITKLETGTITSTTETLKFWTKEVRAAKTGSRGEAHRAQIQAYLDKIEELFIPDPFTFDDADEVKDALAILTAQPKNDYDLLRKELLTAELNWVSYRRIIDGVEDGEGLMSALISWGESVVASNPPASKSGTISAAAEAVGTVSEALDLFRALNSSGGGGGSGNE